MTIAFLLATLDVPPRTDKILNDPGRRTWEEVDRALQRQGTSLHQLRSEVMDDSAAIKKAELLRLGRSGAPHPHWKSQLGHAFYCYTSPTSGSYDADFTQQLKKVAPSWFADRTANTAIKKAELLRLARSGAPRPHHSSQLGRALSRYTFSSYDFAQQIKKAAPKWFKDTATAIKKAELLRLARSGAPRPHWKSQLGNALRRYTQPSAHSYDPDFTKQLRKDAPKWFDSVATKKAELLRLARSGAPRPPANTAIKKAELLRLARSGAPRPHHSSQLGRALRKYTQPSAHSYDPDFTKQIKKAAPSWFSRRRGSGNSGD